MKQLLLYTALFCSLAAFGQKDSTRRDKNYFDTVKYSYANFLRDSLEIVRVPIARPQFRFDNRNIYFNGQNLFVAGYDAGFMLKDKLRVTVGYYQLKNNISTYKTEIDGKQYDRRLSLKYGTVNTEFQYINKRFFSLGMPLELGFGQNSSTYRTAAEVDAPYQTQKGFVVISDFGLSGTFKPIRWIGIRGVVGYRKTVFNQVEDFRFDGIFTSVGLNVDFREITKDFKMFRLMKRYHRIDSKVGTMVDLIVD
jgi:hypothetical protein